MLRMIIVGCSLVASVLFHASASAALFLHWDMNGTPVQSLQDSVGGNHLLPGGSDSNGVPGTTPTYLPTGGVGGSGAYLFNPTGSGNDLMRPTTDPTTMHPAMPSGGGLDYNWTASFWIQTNDSTMKSNGGAALGFQLPVFGERAGQWAFQLGVDGGKAGFFHWDAGYYYGFGNQNIADGEGHYVTFVHKDTGIGSGVFDIYIDGILDVAGLNAHDTNADEANPRYRFRDIGVMNSDGYAVGRFVLDDVRLYDTALSSSEIFGLFAPPPAPEPSSLVLLSLGMLCVSRHRRHRGRSRRPCQRGK